MNQEIKIGSHWVYKRTGKPYHVVGLCMIKTYEKDTENGWSLGVSYEADVPTILQTSTYAREESEFLELFYETESH
jgi:hypothetical protein